MAKTFLMHAMAAALQPEFKRVPCTPDLMPGNVTGAVVYDAGITAFVFLACSPAF